MEVLRRWGLDQYQVVAGAPVAESPDPMTGPGRW
jgi:hypothetical protein